MTDLRKKIAAAIFDPGQTEGYKGERTLTEWQTDAVMTALAAAEPSDVKREAFDAGWDMARELTPTPAPADRGAVEEEAVDAAYAAASSALKGTSADIGAGELDKIVRASVAAALRALALPAAEVKVKPEVIEALDECEAYFDNRADADCDQDGFIPNTEMLLLDKVRTALAALAAPSQAREG